MEDELPDFAGEQSPAPEAAPELQQQPAAETPQEPAPQPAATPVAEAAPQPAPEPAPTAVDPVTGQHVPLPTFLDMRDRASAAEKRAKELEDWRRQQEDLARRQPPPDPRQDPTGFHQHQERQFRQELQAQRVDMSYMMAEQRYGADVTKTARDWGFERCAQDPLFNARVMQQTDPVGFVVQEWKREQFLSKADPTDFEAYLAWKAQQPPQPGQPAPQPSAAPQAQQPGAPPAAPRPSIAAAPSAGSSSEPRGFEGEETYRSIFGQ